MSYDDVYREALQDWLCERDLNDERPSPSEYAPQRSDRRFVRSEDFTVATPSQDRPF